MATVARVLTRQLLRCLVCAVVMLITGHARAQQPLEDEVKAAFLLNFPKFTDWPASAFADDNTPISICLLGESPVAEHLSQLVQGERASGRPIVARAVKRAGPFEGCHILFIARSEKDTAKLLAGLGPGILTVGESNGFLQEGGIIGFVVENRRVRFDISQTRAAKAMLVMNARLLNVARSVEK